MQVGPLFSAHGLRTAAIPLFVVTASEMTYVVSSGALNSTHSLCRFNGLHSHVNTWMTGMESNADGFKAKLA